MFTIQNITVSFGGTTLFEDISFRVGRSDRIGLIGKNGAGKSTLLKLLSQKIQPDSGHLAFEKGVTIGHLTQELALENGRTVLEEAYLAFDEILKIEQRTSQIHTVMAETNEFESDSYQALLNELTDLTERYEIIGGYQYQAETEKILTGLGFLKDDFYKPSHTFSGGWRMRIELAKLLLKQHDVLLLDEPTNHLDMDAIIWLEQFLKKYKGAVILVSHDRVFLDEVTNRTIELIHKRCYDFKKSYSEYMVFREEMRTQQRAAQKNQEKQIQQTERLIERFRAKASKASMAQSLIKKLDKIERIEAEPEDTVTMKLSFPVSVQPGKVILEAKGITKKYGEKEVLSNVDLLVERGSKIAFVGQNGQGKSTLAKIMVGDIVHEGHLQLGHNVTLGYFAQDQADYLEANKTVLQTAEEAATEESRKKVRDLLGAFLFQGDDVDKKGAVLSGGERNRLALCKLLLKPFNVLIMDEPTNHLDMASKEILKEALIKFEGTLILVSHDRDFLDGLCSRVIEFKDRKIKTFLGDINYYLESKKMASLQQLEQSPKISETASSQRKPSDYEFQKKERTLKNKLSKVENEISALEKEIKAIDLELEINYEETIKQPHFFDGYQEKKQQLETLMKKWELVQEQLDGLT